MFFVHKGNRVAEVKSGCTLSEGRTRDSSSSAPTHYPLLHFPPPMFKLDSKKDWEVTNKQRQGEAKMRNEVLERPRNLLPYCGGSSRPPPYPEEPPHHRKYVSPPTPSPQPKHKGPGYTVKIVIPAHGDLLIQFLVPEMLLRNVAVECWWKKYELTAWDGDDFWDGR